MRRKYKKINRLLFILPLMTFMTSCSDWGYNHESSNPITGVYDHPRWDEQGFTLEEYQIYKAGKMNNGVSNPENNPDSALPWKKAGILAADAVKYHQQGQKMNIDDETAIYFAKRNISLDEYMQVKNALNNHPNAKNIVHNREDETKIIQYIKTGLSFDNAILKLKQDQENEEIAEEKRIWGEENYKKCKSFLKEGGRESAAIDGPFDVVGSCYIFPALGLRSDKWISPKQMFVQLPSHFRGRAVVFDSERTLYIESDKKIQVERTMAVIGIKPKFYKHEEGVNRGYVPSFRIINYPEY